MNIVKLNGTKPERIIGGKRYVRQEKTIMAVKDFNSYVDASSNSYDFFMKRAYDEVMKGLGEEKDNYTVFAEIIRKGKNRMLYMTLFKIDKEYKSQNIIDV